MAHVAGWKKQEVAELEELLKKYPVIAVSSIEGLPASQFQEIRRKLKDKALFKVTKLSLLKLAMKNCGRSDVLELDSYLDGPIAIVFSEMNPFKLFTTLKRSRSKAPIRAGQAAPEEIVVPAGDTGLPPGPALGDLKAAGINARIDGGSIKVMRDSVVAKPGEIISAEVASALNKLGMKPVEIGISLTAALENGMIFTSSVLDISEEKTLQDIQAAFRSALNLSVNCAYPTKSTVQYLIAKAFSNARNLGVNAAILDKGVIEHLLAKAHAEAGVLSGYVK